VATPVYATAADLTAYLAPEAVPDGAAERLRDASRDISVALRLATYDVDAAGAPTEPYVIEACRDAACEQALYLADVDDRTGAGGRLASASLDGASYTYSSAAQAAAASGQIEIGPRALQALTLAGVTPADPWNL
jgi:hypothetical protein